MWPVCVLLWKHTMMRKRTFLTLVEYLCPLVSIGLVALTIVAIRQQDQSQRKESNTLSYEDILDQYDQCILYTPGTMFTDRLMDEVGRALGLTRLNHLPRQDELGYYMFANETTASIMDYSIDIMQPEDAIVIFEDIDADTMPKKLTYTIRMKTDFTFDQKDPFDTDKDALTFSIFNMLNEDSNSFDYEAFMRIQWAIDNSYLRMRTGSDIEQVQTLEEFPFKKEDIDEELLIMVPFLSASLFLTLTFNGSITLWVSRLFKEKITGLHELQKSTGVRGETIAFSHVLDFFPVIILFMAGVILYYTCAGYLVHTNPGHLIFPLILYPLSLIAFSFVLLYLLNVRSAMYGQNVVFGILLVFWVATIASVTSVKHRGLSLFCLLLVHAPFFRFWELLGFKELSGKGLTIANMGISIKPVTVVDVYVFLIVQILLFSMLAWYLSKVRPGNHGQPLPWNFLFTKSYWSKQEGGQRQIQLAKEEDDKYFEKPPTDVPVGIQVINVYKSFKDESVLLGVNLAVYRDEITVLLGHNGAGKTTLINIITGLMPASSGRVLVEGNDISHRSVEARKLIGLCPQNNIYFDKLSFMENVRFFAMLKGLSYSQAKTASTQLLAKLELSNKANEMPDDLSGGQKRRLQLACAVVGGAKVLILDEPTSGLDVETRRELWDLLLSFRGDHTVLLTTHFMEEADALGDRIVALHHGRVRCHATSMFLKRAIGTGYRLTFTTFDALNEEAITNTITAVVPDATVRDRHPSGVSYNLPAKDTERFPQLFTAIEAARVELKIDTIGVGKSTLDEVFLELCSDEKLTSEEVAPFEEPVLPKITGMRLRCRQFAALLTRQWHFLNLIVYIIIMVLLCLFIVLFNNITNSRDETPERRPHNNTRTIGLDLYGARPERRALVNVDEDTLAKMRTGYGDVQFDNVSDVDNAALRIRMEDPEDYRNYLVSIQINATSAKAHYTPSLRHAAPVALNALNNARAARMLGARADADARTLTTRSSPLRGAYVSYNYNKLVMPKESINIRQWIFFMVFILCCYLAAMAGLPCTELQSGARHAHIMAGAPRALYWTATLFAHLLRAMPLCIFICACPAFMDKDQTFDKPKFLCSTFLIMLLGMLAFAGLMYLCTTLFNQVVTMAVLLIPSYFFISISSGLSEVGFMYHVMKIPMVLFPPFTFGFTMKRAATVAQWNAFCTLNKEKCPELFLPERLSDCCDYVEPEPWSHFSFSGGTGWALLILCFQPLAYFTLTYLVDDGVFSRLRSKMGTKMKPVLRFDDPAVKAEAQYADRIIQLRECFGLLGVNGSGKSTTFKMLTGELTPSGGEIFANGYRLSQRRSYMHTLSYCPQFAGIDFFMTGRQNLKLFLTLRGLRADDVAKVAASWIKEVDVGKHADKRLISYSGGNARRLTAAVALCQGARTAVLDEPTAGVDPVARRYMHRAILRARRNRSIIVASHSMDEIEALCHRIAIMSGGELRALGTAAALKAQHAQGYFIVFKTTVTDAQDVGLQQFKDQVQGRLDCELKDYFRGMLRYQVKSSLPYSELFTIMEELRQQFPAVLEDYTVTETTLEEVFLALAKEAKEQRRPTA